MTPLELTLAVLEAQPCLGQCLTEPCCKLLLRLLPCLAVDSQKQWGQNQREETTMEESWMGVLVAGEPCPSHPCLR